MGRVEVLEATRIAPNSRGRGKREALNVDRIRVAAYCRVSTDDDDQLGSFESQKIYYEEKIRANRDWVNAGIFADEAITGTKVDKREGFQTMIQKCQNGEIDMVLTKSISRFARNTLDTLQYVRMLRERNIAIYFEKENINTMDMNGELLLTIMSSLAQQEVESLSQNVKMGLKMKMKRGVKNMKKTMRANVYEKAMQCSIQEIPVPAVRDDQILIQVMACGVCNGADSLLAKGEFLAEFPLINGHEFSGIVVEIGKDVTDFKVGDRVTADNAAPCGDCYYCRRDQPLYCENFYSLGCNGPGGFAEYVVVDKNKVFHIPDHVSFDEACFAEPIACAVHTMDRMNIQFSDDVLIFGCGPTGNILAQMVRHSTAGKVVVAAPTKSRLDRLTDAVDGIITVQIDRNDSSKHKNEIMGLTEKGFDIVIDATGSTTIFEDCYLYGKMGAKIVMFAIPHGGKSDRVMIDPTYWYLHELNLITTWAQTHCYERAIKCIADGTVKVKNLVSHVLPLEKYQEGLDTALKGGDHCSKIIIHPQE